MYFAYLDYSKSILLIRKQGYVIENDNNMRPHLKRKTQLSQSLYDDNFFLSADNKIKKNTTPSEQS